MADKSITDLNVVPGSIDDSNTWFAVAQSGAAYKVSGHDFILAMTVILDGHGGIKSITGPTTVGLVDTYTITFADDSTTDFKVTNGKGITGISKTGTSGLVDTYTISYNDGSTSTFTVTNGAKGDTGDSWYVWIRYSGSQPTQDSDMGTEPDNWMGIYSGTSSTAPVHYTDYDWFQIKGEKGDKGDPSTIVSQSVTYQEGTSPNVQPSGTWTTTIPVVSQGNYLWTRTIVTFNSGNPVTFYSVARMGLDGTGSVSSVNNQSPDANGNVTVTASDIGTTDSTSVQSEINGVKNTLTQLEDDVTALDGRFDTAEDDIDNLETATAQLDQNMAYVENGNTASRTYSGGEFISWKGTLYTASGSIPSGTSFATGSGGNLELVAGNNALGGGLNRLQKSMSESIDMTSNIGFVNSQQYPGAASSLTKKGNMLFGDIKFRNTVAGSGVRCYIDGVSLSSPASAIMEQYVDDTIVGIVALINSNTVPNRIECYCYPSLVAPKDYRIFVMCVVD